MQKRKIDELISHFNRKVADMDIDMGYKMELLGMITAIGIACEKELSIEPECTTWRWIPCSERLPEEYGEYLITWETSKAPTRFIGFAEGEETGVWDDQHDRFVFSWLPEDYIIERYPDWRVIAWMPLPEPYKGEQE